MSGGVWIVLGWVVVIGLPAAVLAAVILWPERIPKDYAVEAIRERIEGENQIIRDVRHPNEHQKSHYRRRSGRGGAGRAGALADRRWSRAR